jgi:exopolysaccharide biosynthesis polyprenyl glycosylphosphotransferase
MPRLFRVFISPRVLLLLVSEIVWTAFSFTLAAWLSFNVDPAIFLLYEGGLQRILLVTASIVLALYFFDLYTDIAVRSPIRLAQQLLEAVGVGFITEALSSYVNRDSRLPISLMLEGGALCVAGLLFWRLVYGSRVMGLVGTERVLFAGVSPAVCEVAAHIASRPEVGLEVLGYVGDTALTDSPELGERLGDIQSLKQVVETVRPDRVVVGLSDRRGQLPLAELIDLRVAGYHIEEAATTFESACGRVSLDLLHLSDLVFADRMSPPRRSAMVHAVLDIGVASLATILFSPLMIVVALAIKLTSPGPVFYRQKRIGRRSKPFDMLKFRTMLDEPPGTNGGEPQVTGVGRILRPMRLNELPQFFNVLRREMSIVGPRPERPDYVAVFGERIPFYGQRHSVRPGITGWAQIHVGHGDSVEDTRRKLEYDLYYIKHMSQSLDFYIMFHTVKAVLLARDAG